MLFSTDVRSCLDSTLNLGIMTLPCDADILSKKEEKPSPERDSRMLLMLSLFSDFVGKIKTALKSSSYGISTAWYVSLEKYLNFPSFSMILQLFNSPSSGANFPPAVLPLENLEAHCPLKCATLAIKKGETSSFLATKVFFPLVAEAAQSLISEAGVSAASLAL